MWKTVELQIEALVPGVLIIVEAYSLSKGHLGQFLSSLPRDEFVRGVFFISAAYAVGLVSSYISRLVLDFISERGPRALIFSIFAHGTLEDIEAQCENRDRDFSARKENSKFNWNLAIGWNAVYRSALAVTKRKEEVVRRRGQGRLLRNLLIPSILAITLLAKYAHWALWMELPNIILIVLLYGYCEYVNFAEAYDIYETPATGQEHAPGQTLKEK